MTGKKNLRVRFTEAIEIRELELSDEERESKSAHWRQIQERKREMKVKFYNLIIIKEMRKEMNRGRIPKQECHFRVNGWNTIVNFVPQQEAWVIERMGKFNRILQPGLNFLLPFVDQIRYIHCLKEMTFVIPQQEAITMDNVQLDLDAVLFVRIVDPYKASYGVQNPEFAITTLAQTVMRSEVGKLMLDAVFRERANLNLAIVEGITDSANPWGMVCLQCVIGSIIVPVEIQRAMKMQVEAERRKRAVILDSEGVRQSDMNKAEGEKNE